MKRCPECRRDYYDDTLAYCLEDGAALVSGVPGGSVQDESQTQILYDTDPPYEAGTRPQIKTADERSSGREPSSSRGLSFSVKAAALIAALIAIAIGGFFGYRYLSVSPKPVNSIAVMPFVNVGGNGDLEYLSDGVTESLINSLSQISNLSVKGRSSVFRYKGKDIEPQQVAKELNVQTVLNGRVTQHGESLIVSLDLVDAATGNQLWGEQYDRRISDLASVQSEIARDVSQKLRAKLTGADETKVVKNQTQNTEAYQLYLQGRYNWNMRTDAGTQKAIEYFQEAIEKDPNYAMAYVGLAESYMIGGGKYTEAGTAALRAMEIDPTLGEPHAVLAGIKERNEYDFSTAEQEYQRAIVLNPSYATGYHWYATFLVKQGRFDESVPLWNKALELEPLSFAISTDYGYTYLYSSRKYDQAINYLKKIIDLDPSYVRTHHYLAEVYDTMGRHEDAVNENEKSRLLEGENSNEIAMQKAQVLEALRSGGAKGYWSKVLELTSESRKKGNDIPNSYLAALCSQLGDNDEAFNWLDKAYNDKEDLTWLKIEPMLDNIRDDPRFKDLMKRVNFPE